LLLRYRARNWPDSLDAGERAQWNALPAPPPAQRQRPVRIQFRFLSRDDRGAARRHEAGPAQALLDALEDWGRQIDSDIGA
jgi:exodeoxyribonuclease-1